MKARVYVIALLAISAMMLILTSNNALVLADPCTATLSYPILPVSYSTPSAPLVVPVSASCTTYYGSQLYASGTAYDLTSNTALGTATTALSSVSGGTQFNGQLGFNLLPTSPGDSVQISVTIYTSQGGSLITETSETFQLESGLQPGPQQIITTTTVTEGQYPAYNPYPTSYPSTYQPNQSQGYLYQSQYPSQNRQGYQSHSNSQGYFFSQYFAQQRNNANLFDYIVIIAIIATVIIATAGLVLVARRQPYWVPSPPVPR